MGNYQHGTKSKSMCETRHIPAMARVYSSKRVKFTMHRTCAHNMCGYIICADLL